MTKQEILETESPRWGGKPMNGVGMCLKDVYGKIRLKQKFRQNNVNETGNI